MASEFAAKMKMMINKTVRSNCTCAACAARWSKCWISGEIFFVSTRHHSWSNSGMVTNSWSSSGNIPRRYAAAFGRKF